MAHWSWNEEEARKCNRAKIRARQRVKEIFGAALVAASLGTISARTVLEIADTSESDKRVSSATSAGLADLEELGL